MSKYGKVEVKVYSVYSVEQLQKFADKVGITLAQAESIAKERLYRAAYNKLRNKDPKVKGSRKEYNKKRQELSKQLR
jgi:CRISPR/Cas system CMR-associated protein Cmr3 (group 5 of RAMP superfamily)